MSQLQLAQAISPDKTQPRMFQQSVTPGQSLKGDRWIDADTGQEYYFNGTSWVLMTAGSIDEETDPLFNATRMGLAEIATGESQVQVVVVGLTVNGAVLVTQIYTSDEVGVVDFAVERGTDLFRIKSVAPAPAGATFKFIWWVPRFTLGV